MTTTDLDHVGIAGQRLEELAAAYERLGFTLAPFSRHSAPPEPGAEPVPIGTGNRCVMLRRGYLELIAVVEPGLYDFGIAEDLARYAGIHIVAFATSDPEATAARLNRDGFPAKPYHLSRMAETRSGVQRARFTNLPMPRGTFPEGNLFFLRHETPEVLWEPHLLDHANGAQSLDAVMFAVADPEETAARLARFLGVPPVADGPMRRFRLAGTRVDIVGGPDLPLLTGAASRSLPFVAGIEIAVASLERTRRVLSDNGVRHAAHTHLLRVAPAEAGGVNLSFVGAVR